MKKHLNKSLITNGDDGSDTSATNNNIPTINEPPPESRALEGLSVHIIHVKDPLTDGPSAKDVILRELLEWEEKVALGCTFSVTHSGESIWI